MHDVELSFIKKDKLYGVLKHKEGVNVLPLSNDYEVEFFIMLILSLECIEDRVKGDLIEQVIKNI